MTPYCDFGFLAVLLVRAPGTGEAWKIVRQFEAPFPINYLHVLQIHNLFVRGQLEGNPRQKQLAADGQRLWKTYLDESVFLIQNPDWDVGYRLALTLTDNALSPVPPPTLLLHAGLAAAVGATHLLSFDPRTRRGALALGLHVLPEKL